MHEHTRIHALDNLRAVMMWLGIVLHVAIMYTTAPTAFPFHDRHASAAADLLLLFIHSFRMPVFFILAGFFAALMSARDGPGAMFRNRLRRIGLPFAIFWPLLFAATIVASMLFVHVMARGTLGLDPGLMQRPPGGAPMVSTIHLWFLYYLLIFCAIAAAIVPRAGKHAARLHAVAARVGRAWWAPLVLALPAMLIGFSHPVGIAPNRTSFLPYPDELIYNGLFFAFGWQLYHHRDALLAHYASRWRRYAGAGALLFILYLGTLAYFKKLGLPMPPGASLWTALAYGCVNWLFSFALLGMFARHLHRPGALLGYLARSSYCVYLLHFPLTMVIGALLYRWDAGAPLKMLANVAATTALCLLAYYFLVRPTWIGRLLNGTARRGAVSASGALLDNKPVLH